MSENKNREADAITATASKIRYAMKELGDEYRAVVLDAYEQFGATEAAKRLGVSRNAIYQVVDRARKHES